MVMFGLDLSFVIINLERKRLPSFVILVPERKRGIDTGIQETFDSLFDLNLRVKPEGDYYVFYVAQKCHASKPRFYTLKGEQKFSFFTLLLIYYLSSPFQSISESYAEIF